MTRNVYPLVLGAMLCLANAAAADLVVVVSAKSTVDKLTVEQVKQIFMGKTEYFPNGNPAIPLDQVEASSLRGAFDSAILDKTIAQVKGYWAKLAFTASGHAPKELPNSAEVKAVVAANPNTIGYIDKASVDTSVKVVLSE